MMLIENKRLSKFECYWENDIKFRRIVYKQNGDMTLTSEYYSDLLFSSREWTYLIGGLLVDHTLHEPSCNNTAYGSFYKCGWKLGLEGVIAQLSCMNFTDLFDKNLSYLKKDNLAREFDLFLKSKKVSLKEYHLYCFIDGLYGVKYNSRQIFSRRAWLINFAGYEHRQSRNNLKK